MGPLGSPRPACGVFPSPNFQVTRWEYPINLHAFIRQTNGLTGLGRGDKRPPVIPSITYLLYPLGRGLIRIPFRMGPIEVIVYISVNHSIDIYRGYA